MYHLFVTSKTGQWNKTAHEYEGSRAIEEFTDKELFKKYGVLNEKAIGEMKTFPCLFAYEYDNGLRGGARIGWLTDIKKRTGRVRIEYEIEESIPPILSSDIKKLNEELDIIDGELFRTHWSIKDIFLIPALIKAGVLSEEISKSQPNDSRLIRFGLTKPITSLHVEPTVFRVPDGGIDKTLVSVMMPFNEEFDFVYSSIKTACELAGFQCKRADDIWERPEIIQDIFALIYRSRVVICDFSKKNPNVFYEAGIAHTLGREVIPIVEKDGEIPFDLKHFRFLKYNQGQKGLKSLEEKIKEKLLGLLN